MVPVHEAFESSSRD